MDASPRRGRSPSPAAYASNINQSHSSLYPHSMNDSAQTSTFPSFDANLDDGVYTNHSAFTSTFSGNGNSGGQFLGLDSNRLHAGANQNDFGSTTGYLNGTLAQEGGAHGANSFGRGDYSYDNTRSLNPSLLSDPSPPATSNNTLDPSTLSLDLMATMQGHHSPTPPHLLPSHSASSSHSPSPSPRHSPSPSQLQQQFSGRPRNTSESLDPSSAAYPQGYPGDWGAGHAFQAHRRQPSDTLSEISSHSNQASPYLHSMDSFDHGGHSNHVSPLLAPENDPQLFNDAMNLQQFSISDGLSPLDHMSPAHSIHSSPRLPVEQQPLPAFTATDNFGMPIINSFETDDMGNYNDFSNNNTYNPNAFPNLDTGGPPLEGQADAMSPPEINIDFAPPSRQPSFGPRPRASSGNELIPPEAMRRRRAKSDPHSSASRSSSPGVPNRGRSPSLQPSLNNSSNLTPDAIELPASRSPSPAGRNRSASSASTDSRQYLLDLADPDRPSASAGIDGRRQKHPATFQCHLCPKRFTRAYNLRSHLRTHTDERPFVCTVCGKAFARQHDRKRHEGLHSGEKKFVCRGVLKTGQPWGCNRRFARADALGRHFRSEAGRECIKPLLDEEAEERQKTWLEEQAQQQLQSAQGFVAPPPITEQPQMSAQLPASILQQFPELAGFNFSGPVDSMGGGIDEDYATGRSSFDASSGGEYDLSDTDISGYEPMQDMHLQQQQQQQGQSYGLPPPTWTAPPS